MDLNSFSFRRKDTQDKNWVMVTTPEGESEFFWDKFNMGSLGNRGSSEAYLLVRKFVAKSLGKMEPFLTNDEIISVLVQKCPGSTS